MDNFKIVVDIAIPILVIVVLIVLIVLLISLVKLIKNLTVTLGKTDETIVLVNKSIDKVQEPLDTVVKVSKTVSKVHDSTVDAVGEAKQFVVQGVDVLKDKIKTYKKGKEGEKQNEQ